MVFIDHLLYRNRGFGVRWGIGVLALATLPRFGNVTSVAGQTAYREVPVGDGAELVGRAFFCGQILDPRRLLVTKDEEVCGFGYPERTEVVVGEDQRLAGVVVGSRGLRAVSHGYGFGGRCR